jgi:osomolarity two-component system, response regulator SKN7
MVASIILLPNHPTDLFFFFLGKQKEDHSVQLPPTESQFVPASEAQRIIGGTYPESDVARASFEQMNEISRRANTAGLQFTGAATPPLSGSPALRLLGKMPCSVSKNSSALVRHLDRIKMEPLRRRSTSSSNNTGSSNSNTSSSSNTSTNSNNSTNNANNNNNNINNNNNNNKLPFPISQKASGPCLV